MFLDEICSSMTSRWREDIFAPGHLLLIGGDDVLVENMT